MPHFDGLLLNHPRSPKNVRHAASVAIDRNGYVRLPGELDVRALELHERFGARERTDHGPSQGAVDRLRSVTRVLDLDRGRRRLRVPRQTKDDRQPPGTPGFLGRLHRELVTNLWMGWDDEHGSRIHHGVIAGPVLMVHVAVEDVGDDLLRQVRM